MAAPTHGTDRFETPERVGIDIELADMGTRALAFAIDGAILAVATAGAFAAAVALSATIEPSIVVAVALIAVFVAWWGYFAVQEIAFRGQTLGKRVLGIRVRRVGGYPAGAPEILVRNLLRIVVDLAALVLPIGLLVMLLHPRNRRVGDLLAGTVVVRERAARRAAAEDAHEEGTVPASPAEANAVAHLTVDDFELVRDYLERAASLDRASRERLCGEVARYVRERLAGGDGRPAPEEWSSLPDEVFLGRVAAAYRTGLRSFEDGHRAAWDRLEELVRRSTRVGIGALSPDELRELGLLHRQISADLAAVRTFHGGARLERYLNDLALRSHNAVYRAPRRRPREVWEALAYGIPRAVRSAYGALAGALLFFWSGAVLGAIGAALDEGTASLVLGPEFIDQIRDGTYLAEDFFMSSGLLAAFFATNNTSVALYTYITGITGVLPAYILFQNGLLLGTVFTLCARYGLSERFLSFVFGHGVIELSAIFLAGAAAFVTFDGWLHPGRHRRAEGLRRGALVGLKVFGAAVPALAVAALVEGFVSPNASIPGAVRVGLGLVLGIALWAWILLAGRGRGETPRPEDAPGESAGATVGRVV